MRADDRGEESSPLQYFDTCTDKVGQGEYAEALLTLRRGVQQSLASAEEINGQQLLTNLLEVLLKLEAHLDWTIRESLTLPARLSAPKAKGDELRCSFCGKLQSEVEKLIAGPTLYICNECVSICNEIIREGGEAGSGEGIA